MTYENASLVDVVVRLREDDRFVIYNAFFI
jgi:hypothetical protein